jgi:hypothetical protein
MEGHGKEEGHVGTRQRDGVGEDLNMTEIKKTGNVRIT